MYILNPSYGDMPVVVLGSSLKTIQKKLRQHWEEELSYPDYYEKSHIEAVNQILNKEYSSIQELINDYVELIDEDYSFEESY
jgi:hypothetical protein